MKRKRTKTRLVRKEVKTSSLPRLLTQTQLAQELGVSRETVRLWFKKGHNIPYVRLGSKRYYIADHIKAWLDSEIESSLNAKN